MLSKETVLNIVTYCKEHNVPYNSRCKELDIPLWRFYDAKKHYKNQETKTGEIGEFIQLRSVGPLQPGNLNQIEGKTTKGPVKPGSPQSGIMSLELQTRSGTVLRLYGEMTPAMLHELAQLL
jgi:hypothetical protein